MATYWSRTGIKIYLKLRFFLFSSILLLFLRPAAMGCSLAKKWKNCKKKCKKSLYWVMFLSLRKIVLKNKKIQISLFRHWETNLWIFILVFKFWLMFLHFVLLFEATILEKDKRKKWGPKDFSNLKNRMASFLMFSKLAQKVFAQTDKKTQTNFKITYFEWKKFWVWIEQKFFAISEKLLEIQVKPLNVKLKKTLFANKNDWNLLPRLLVR